MELAFDHGVGVRGQKIKKANEQKIYSVSDGGRQREGEKVGKGAGNAGEGCNFKYSNQIIKLI